jgi:hypothetical protein
MFAALGFFFPVRQKEDPDPLHIHIHTHHSPNIHDRTKQAGVTEWKNNIMDHGQLLSMLASLPSLVRVIQDGRTTKSRNSQHLTRRRSQQFRKRLSAKEKKDVIP